MQESALHASLKDYYTAPGASQEVMVDGYCIDVVHGDLLIEIQTRNFAAIRDKIISLVERHPVRLVHPVAQEKWIVRLPVEGEIPLSRRKSPRRGRPEHIFIELVRIPDLLKHPNFSLEVLMVREEEIRRVDGKGSWRRNGVSIANRRLLEVLDCYKFNAPSDLYTLLPSDLILPFTNRQLAEKLAISRNLASRMSYCLRSLGLLKIAGKQNRSYLYSRTE
jgi:hypothetical protein